MLKLQRFFPQNRNKPQLSQNHIHEIERMDIADQKSGSNRNGRSPSTVASQGLCHLNLD